MSWKQAILTSAGLIGTLSLSAPAAIAQSPSGSTAAASTEIVVTGTRVANRSRLDTVAPVDIVTSETLAQLGTTELNQALSVALPSFNFPRPALSDGTDAVRPATLRGLAPDQTLILVNSKRRHASALVNINTTVGRGSSAVDLNTIPAAAISSVEVLRDGASAQYGSDAIAGVINVRLREAPEGGSVSVTMGKRFSTVETLPRAPVGDPLQASIAGPQPTQPVPNWTITDANREVEDGFTFITSGWVGLGLGEDGFLTVSGDLREQEGTVRGAPDARQQYPLVGGAYDPREQTVNRLNTTYGDPKIDQYTLFANAGYTLAPNVSLYGWASYQSRETFSAGFFRRPIQATPVTGLSTSQNNLDVFPDGFLPVINAETTDASAAVGVEFGAIGWDLDASVVYGKNTIDFVIRDTINVTIPTAQNTQRVFDAGGPEYEQVTANLGAVRGFDVGLASPLNVALGIEAREEKYAIRAGERASWDDFGFRPFPQVGMLPQFPAAPGSQVFPGFRPTDVVDESRTAVSGYVDFEANITDALLVSAAGRYEDYSDFGAQSTGKLAARYDFADWFALRGAAATGFRAPSLQQSFLTSTSTNFVNGLPLQIITAPATSALAKSLGSKPLEAETSNSISTGFVVRAGAFSLTVDGYFIEIADRIILSENITVPPPGVVLPVGIQGARFFINGVDTETQGLDVVATYLLGTDSLGDFNFTASVGLNETEITRAPPASLFGRIARNTLVEGQPKEKATLQTVWTGGNLGATARANYYGAVVEPGTSADGSRDVKLGEKVLIDLEGRLSIDDRLELAFGSENVFDEYPDATPPALNATGTLAFSRYSPFGFNGRYVYGRLTYSW